MKKVLSIAVSLALLLCMLMPAFAAAADYPRGTVEIVVPFAAGGGMDLLARAAQPYLAEKGIQTVVTNMAGASSSIGTMDVYYAPADGYKILCSGIETIIAFHLGGVLEPDIDEFTNLGTLVYDSHVIIVPKDSPFQTLEDLVTYAKEHPGELNWGGTASKGNGEMSAHEFWKAAGISMNYVPYDSAANTRIGIMGGHVDCGMVFISEAKPLLESGDVRGLVVFTADRSQLFPDIPAVNEFGYNIDNGLHRGFFAQKDLPDDIRAILADAFKYAFDNETFRKDIEDQCGFAAVYLSPDDCDVTAVKRAPDYQTLYNIMMEAE